MCDKHEMANVYKPINDCHLNSIKCKIEKYHIVRIVPKSNGQYLYRNTQMHDNSLC